MVKVLSWEGVSEKTVRQILSEAESFMAAQLQVALATDQRAITAASIFSAFSTAVVGAAIAYWAQSEDTPLVTALMVAGVLLTAAAFCCFWAARPINFYFPGNHQMTAFDSIRGAIRPGRLGAVPGPDRSLGGIPVESVFLNESAPFGVRSFSPIPYPPNTYDSPPWTPCGRLKL